MLSPVSSNRRNAANLYCVTNGRIGNGFVELIVTVCASALPNQCEDQHLSFPANMSPHRRVMNAQAYITQWINEHPKWVAVRWRCDIWRLQGENLIRRRRSRSDVTEPSVVSCVATP